MTGRFCVGGDFINLINKYIMCGKSPTLTTTPNRPISDLRFTLTDPPQKHGSQGESENCDWSVWSCRGGWRVETRQVIIRLPVKGDSKSHGARPVHQIVSMMKWIRNSELSIRNPLSRWRHVPHEVIKANIKKRTFRGFVWQWGLLFANCQLKRQLRHHSGTNP